MRPEHRLEEDSNRGTVCVGPSPVHSSHWEIKNSPAPPSRPRVELALHLILICSANNVCVLPSRSATPPTHRPSYLLTSLSDSDSPLALHLPYNRLYCSSTMTHSTQVVQTDPVASSQPSTQFLGRAQDNQDDPAGKQTPSQGPLHTALLYWHSVVLHAHAGDNTAHSTLGNDTTSK